MQQSISLQREVATKKRTTGKVNDFDTFVVFSSYTAVEVNDTTTLTR